jgi:hypothetical protein
VRTSDQTGTCYRKRLVQHDEFLHQRHEEYVPQRDLLIYVLAVINQTKDLCYSYSSIHISKPPRQSGGVLKKVCTDRYPKTQQKSDDQPSRSPHTAVSCSSPCQCEQSCIPSAIALHYHFQWSYWIISGRMGD